MRLPFLIATALVLALALAACGGEEDVPGADVTVDTTEVDTTEAADELAQRAEEVDRIIEEQVRGLGDVRSLDDLSERLENARSELDRAASDIADTEVPEDREDERAELEQRVRELSSELEEAQGRVDENDLRGALDAVRDLEAVEGLESLIDRIRAEAGA